MKQKIKMLFACGCLAAWSAGTLAQSFTWYSSTEDNMWQTSVVKMAKKAGNPLVTVDEDEKPIVEFKAWLPRLTNWTGTHWDIDP